MKHTDIVIQADLFAAMSPHWKLFNFDKLSTDAEIEFDRRTAWKPDQPAKFPAG